jgi:hypothetical protein
LYLFTLCSIGTSKKANKEQNKKKTEKQKAEEEDSRARKVKERDGGRGER